MLDNKTVTDPLGGESRHEHGKDQVTESWELSSVLTLGDGLHRGPKGGGRSRAAGPGLPDLDCSFLMSKSTNLWE